MTHLSQNPTQTTASETSKSSGPKTFNYDIGLLYGCGLQKCFNQVVLGSNLVWSNKKYCFFA